MARKRLASNDGGTYEGAEEIRFVQFYAGRMKLWNNTPRPLSEKGCIYLKQSAGGLIHFCWQNCTTGKVEEDIIVFPSDSEYSYLEEYKHYRAYVLKFKTSPRRLYFWMQEPLPDRDDEYCKLVNDLIHNPPLHNCLKRHKMQLIIGEGQIESMAAETSERTHRDACDDAPKSKHSVKLGYSKSCSHLLKKPEKLDGHDEGDDCSTRMPQVFPAAKTFNTKGTFSTHTKKFIISKELTENRRVLSDIAMGALYCIKLKIFLKELGNTINDNENHMSM